jgi:thioredoxin-related protein
MNFRKQILAIVILGSMVLLPKLSFSQLKSYPFEQIDSLQKAEKRNTVVFIHTDWCKYCQTMKNTTLKNDSIIHKLNTQFYFIDLNAEQKEKIVFNKHTFEYKPTGANTGIHELAEQLANVDNQVAFPTFCFLNSNNEIIFQHNAFLNSTDLITILTRLK